MVLSGTIMFYIQSLADISIRLINFYILWDNGFISILSFFKYPNHTFIVKRNFHIIFFSSYGFMYISGKNLLQNVNNKTIDKLVLKHHHLSIFSDNIVLEHLVFMFFYCRKQYWQLKIIMK